MKKSLLKVTASIIGLLGSNAAMAFDATSPKAPVMPVNEGYYYIFDAHRINDATTEEQPGGDDCRYAFRYDDNGTIKGTHKKPYNVSTGAATLENKHVWQAFTEDDGTTWSFKNVGTQRWIKATCATGNEGEKGLFVIEDIEGDNVNAYKVRVNNTVDTYWDGNAGDNFNMSYWEGVGHPIRFYEAVPDDNNGYRIASDNAWNVTYTFPAIGDRTFSYTVPVANGADAANYILALDFFTNPGLQEGNTTVSETAKEFNVTGTWNLPFNNVNTVCRLALKPTSNTGKVVSVNETETETETGTETRTEITTNVATTTSLSKTALWYFNIADYDDSGRPILTLHSLNNWTNNGTNNKGVNMANSFDNDGNERTNGDHATATLTENPTQFVLIPCSRTDKQANDFCLKALDFGDSNCFVNDRGQKFSTWSNAGAHSDQGSVIRAYSLSDADFDALRLAATAEEINTAKENPTLAAISALIDQFQRDPLAPAIAAAEAFDGTIGTGLGQYNNIGRNFADLLQSAKNTAQSGGATDEEKNIIAATIATSTLSLNMPVPGRFYRFHYGNKYLTSKVNSDQRFIIEQQSDPDNTSVFYYDAYTEGSNKSHLVTYPGGLVMGNLLSEGKANGSYKGVLKTSNVAGQTITFSASPSERGKYRMVIGERHVYHMDAQVDAANGTGNAAGYQWEITEVEYLPTPYNGSGSLSICVPVDLNFGRWAHATPYIGVRQGDNIGKKQLVEPIFDRDGGTEADRIVPANTPVFLDVRTKSDGSKDTSNGCVYVNVIYSETSAQTADVTNSLSTASIYAGATKAGGQSYFTLNETGNRFVPAGDNLPAFAAILQVPTEEANTDGYAIADYDPTYTSISEIEGAANNGKQVIYDLQGRRVQRASKGIYIINGVKTIVK